MLEVKSLGAGYSYLQVVWDISLNVVGGEFVALIGPNGAGKTTTLKTITGLLKPMQGEIRFLDRVTNELHAQQITRMGLSLVPEDTRLFEGMTVLDNLLLGAYILKDRKKIRDTLDFVLQLFPRLGERKNQLAGTLSGGERKMLAIGRGLMSKPKLLMVDEPSLGLAPKLVLAVFDALKQLRQEGVTILLVEQNAYTALEISDRAYVLEHGRVALEGDSKKLLENEYVRNAYLGI